MLMVGLGLSRVTGPAITPETMSSQRRGGGGVLEVGLDDAGTETGIEEEAGIEEDEGVDGAGDDPAAGATVGRRASTASHTVPTPTTAAAGRMPMPAASPEERLGRASCGIGAAIVRLARGV